MVRFKCRHLLVEFFFDPPPTNADVGAAPSTSRAPQLDERSIAGAIRDSVAACFGDVGASTVTSSLSGARWPDSLATARLYIGARACSLEGVDIPLLARATMSSVKHSADAPPVKYYSPVTRLCLLRVARDGAATLWASLTLIRSIKGQAVCIRVLHSGGTIRKTQQAAIAEGRRRIIASGGATGADGREQRWADDEAKILALQP